MTKHILIGKIGKALKIKGIKIATGGDALLIFYSSIARMNPDFKFYFIGPNQLDKLTEEEYEYIFPNKNVFSAFGKDNSAGCDLYHPIVDYFKERDIKPDFALLFNGMASTKVNIPNFIKKKDGTYKKVLMSYGNYAAPYIYTLNELGLPTYVLSEDARYITINAEDLYNDQKLILTQMNTELSPGKHIVSKTDHNTVPAPKVPCIYSHIEKIFLMGLDKDWRSHIDIEHKMNSTGNHLIIISNGCGTTHINKAGNNSSRLNEYKKWIFDGLKGTPYENTKIYGKWDDEIYDEYPNIQNKLLVDLGDEVDNAKYTLVYSQIPGFVTVKPWEMIIKGIIPFIHPEYDCNRLLGLPEYLYPKDINDFISKMEYLDANPDEYKKLLEECFTYIKPEYLDGSFLNNFIFDKIAELEGFEYEHKKGIESIFNHFDPELIQFKKKDNDE